ncbi:S8 family serine peptidase [Actinomycetospora endophytica]|uniref:S8 family serine peptidase n=1 Tax=Actinomycetospora endophytica TaxID=2291215 RepID=A0ABS8P612_9PSEU|nr:S8 family serine peptidase [Actinomycetospora endophytica]MCD2193697.1 S8 family serine peptidase [Actinomycetospora endophytica]
MTSPQQLNPGRPEYTGRSILVMELDAHPDEESLARTVRSFAGTSSIASSSDFGHHAMVMDQIGDEDATLFPNLGLAVVPGGAERVAALRNAATTDARIRSVEPEQVMYALAAPADAPIGDQQLEQYLRGYRDAASALLTNLGLDGATVPTQFAPNGAAATASATFADTDATTWGLQAALVDTSPWTGEGIRLAVLDTGIDLTHPDVVGRRVINQSFVPDEEVQDGNGHGTHTSGTAAGPRVPPSGSRRYGVAGSANLFVGKVLSDAGSGSDSQVLAGMEWAVTQRCQVISMSLGSNDPTVSSAYEAVGQRALDAGCLIVAAAGNNATRPGDPGFVGRPANSTSVMAVGAIDPEMQIARFSARTGPAAGGQVDIAGPGTVVFSAWPLPDEFKTIQGTSMATPHVSGIAALYAQATGATGMTLWGEVVRGARQLTLPSVDVGAGLVQAPR